MRRKQLAFKILLFWRSSELYWISGGFKGQLRYLFGLPPAVNFVVVSLGCVIILVYMNTIFGLTAFEEAVPQQCFNLRCRWKQPWCVEDGPHHGLPVFTYQMVLVFSLL